MQKILALDLAEKSYPIVINQNWLKAASQGDDAFGLQLGASNEQKSWVHLNYLNDKAVLLVSNPTIFSFYKQDVLDKFAGFRKFNYLLIEDGEKYKSRESLQKIYDTLIENNYSRDCLLVAFGGGVIGDLVGFAAATYQRGVDFIQIPTTLLSQVDSSVGGKTGINHTLGKNMIGAFWQPKLVIIDLNLLKTLADTEFASGLAEVVKYGLILDESFFSWLVDNHQLIVAGDVEYLTHLVYKSCSIKAGIVIEDEKEQAKRALLNLGHTFGHALENILGYGKLLHGQAVAIGMVLAANLSHKLGLIEQSDVQKIQDALQLFNLPTKLPENLQSISAAKILEAMYKDKKVIDGKLRLIVLKSIGQATIMEVEDKLLLEVLDAI